jgi:hypothetical protein
MLELGYPKHLISVEKSLKDLASLTQASAAQLVPNRRVDIVCYCKITFKPLIMIECKAHLVTKKALYQLIGYNSFIRSPFIALADPEKILVGFYDFEDEDYRFMDVLPTYQILSTATQIE